MMNKNLWSAIAQERFILECMASTDHTDPNWDKLEKLHWNAYRYKVGLVKKSKRVKWFETTHSTVDNRDGTFSSKRVAHLEKGNLEVLAGVEWHGVPLCKDDVKSAAEKLALSVAADLEAEHEAGSAWRGVPVSAPAG